MWTSISAACLLLSSLTDACVFFHCCEATSTMLTLKSCVQMVSIRNEKSMRDLVVHNKEQALGANHCCSSSSIRQCFAAEKLDPSVKSCSACL